MHVKQSTAMYKNTIRLLPGYIVLIGWVLFTVILLGWVLSASLSTTSEIFSGNVLKFPSGLHWENYKKAWISSNVSVFFTNSLIYATISCILLIIICAPYAYTLQRFNFRGKKIIYSTLAATMGVPIVMIIIPLYTIIAQTGVLKAPLSNRIVLITLFTSVKIPYTTTFLMAYFANISSTYEEAAAIDGCHPIRTFWNEYFLSLLFVNSDKLRPVALGLFSMINGMKYSGDWSGLFASVIIVFLPTFILYLFLSKKIIGGITGGIKG